MRADLGDGEPGRIQLPGDRARIRGVLFDFDGTLTRPGSLDFPAIKREMGCPVDQPILEYLEKQPAHRRARMLEILEEMEDKAAEVSRPNQGVERCLSLIREHGLAMGILTRNSIRSVKKALKWFQGIAPQDFAAIITREVSPPKPKPDGVIEAARRMGLPPSQVLVVGDFRFDILAGKAAGAPTALLTNGGRTAMAPGDPEPDHIVGQFEEIMGILGLRERQD
jgi:HAD superfamily hydrolase (TIGR01509 family)